MSISKNNRKQIKSKKKRTAQVFLIGAIIATIYVIGIAMTFRQLQIHPVDDTHNEFWTLSHVYVNIKQELHTVMTMFLADYTRNDVDTSQLEQIFEQIALHPIERYCDQQGITAQLHLIQPLTIQNGTYRTDGILNAYANASTTIRITLKTDHAKIEDERALQLAYMIEIRNPPPSFRAELWTTTEQNIKTPAERVTVQLINTESQERITADTFHNGTYYSFTDNTPDKVEILFETGILFVIFFP